MDYGQNPLQNNTPGFFSSGQGVDDPNRNDFEAENNLNTENWNVSPDRNSSGMGNIAISSASNTNTNNQNIAAIPTSNSEFLPLPSTEAPVMPAEVYRPTSESLAPTSVDIQTSPELGQITPAPYATNAPAQPAESLLEDAQGIFTRVKAMSDDRLSDKALNLLQDKTREYQNADNFAALNDFLTNAREEFQGKAA